MTASSAASPAAATATGRTRRHTAVRERRRLDHARHDSYSEQCRPIAFGRGWFLEKAAGVCEHSTE
ncbi:hypothetical protein [Dactylosporangium sp. CA-139066]|uniref:hypothetical protein n=1 Tax=Dactylosporangium sp. CA-139066 TaxID=3239930 RepID=UPI003D8EB926